MNKYLVPFSCLGLCNIGEICVSKIYEWNGMVLCVERRGREKDDRKEKDVGDIKGRMAKLLSDAILF